MKAGTWQNGTLLASLLLLAALPAMRVAGAPVAAPESESDLRRTASQSTSQAPEAQPAGKPEQLKLSPALVALRDRLRAVLAFYGSSQIFNTRDHTPNDILNLCLAFGAEAEVAYDGPGGSKANAIGCLVWNLPCAGYSLLQVGDGRIMPRVGYGFQDRPAQFLAILAQSRVVEEYEIRAGGLRQTVADLVAFEKLGCRAGTDMSLRLVALSYYLPADAVWQTPYGESWSLERVLREELEREVSQADSEATNRLLGISYAVDHCRQHDQPLKGQFARADQHLTDCQKFALGIANADGSWHPRFFAARGPSSDAWGSLRATGHILEWLAFSLADERLTEPQLVKSVSYLTEVLENWRGFLNVGSLSPRHTSTLMHALHALATYDRRVFKPHDARKPAAENGKSQGAANRAGGDRAGKS